MMISSHVGLDDFKAVVAGPAGSASARPLFSHICYPQYHFLPFQSLLSCLPVIYFQQIIKSAAFYGLEYH